jgi:hypothetical protein
VNAPANPSTGDEAVPEGFTAEDLRLGRTASKIMRTLSALALVACLGIAIFVLTSVPLDTRMPYSSRFGRNGIIAPIAVLPALIVTFGLWRAGKKPDAHHMRKGSRVGTYILGAGLISACVFFQWTFAGAILEAGGYFG